MQLHFAKYKKRRTFPGFSLVEVALALGILGFVMISLIGLLPGGLASFKQAMNNTIESQIVQSVSNDLLLGEFSVLTTYATGASPTYYYDHEGVRLPGQTGAVYKATLSLTPVDRSNSPVDFRHNQARTFPPLVSAYNVLITISCTFDNPEYSQRHPRQFSMIVANSGR